MADFVTLISTYAEGFVIIIEPFDQIVQTHHNPILQLACLDASLAIKPVFERFQSVVITSGTLSPMRFYPSILGFTPKVSKSLQMSIVRKPIRPIIVTKGSDQVLISSQFDKRDDPSVVRNYGALLIDLAAVVPDGMICFFTSYSYMEKTISTWHSLGILNKILKHKLIFIETKDIVETTLALDNYKRACDCGRGAIFFSVARGKVSEGIDFEGQYGRCVIMIGIPYQYTKSKILLARLEYLRKTRNLQEKEVLTFDALRQTSQCVGRIIRSKRDYGVICFADWRYARHDKRNKLPQWISSQLTEDCVQLSTDMAVTMASSFLTQAAQPFTKEETEGISLLDKKAIEALERDEAIQMQSLPQTRPVGGKFTWDTALKMLPRVLEDILIF